MGKYPNSGILSKNQKRKSDKHPEYTGSAEIDGVEYWLGAWVNESDKGKYFKISFTRKEEQSQQQSASSQRRREPDDDEVPF